MVDAVRTPTCARVGLGVPSVVEFETGRVVSSVNVPLADVPLRQVLASGSAFRCSSTTMRPSRRSPRPTTRSCKLVARNLVMLTVGTGVGGGLVLGGRIYRGATGGAGELGHTIVGLDLAGAGAVADAFPAARLARVRRLGSRAGPPRRSGRGAASRVARSDGCAPRASPCSAPTRSSAAQAGDAAAQRMVEIWGQRVGIGVANAINTFDPDEVVIGGGAAQAGDLLLEPARRVAKGYVLPGLGQATTIRLARHGVYAGVLGAALLARA